MVFPTRKTFQGKHLAKFNMAEDEESMTNFTVQLTLPHLNTVGKTVPPPLTTIILSCAVMVTSIILKV